MPVAWAAPSIHIGTARNERKRCRRPTRALSGKRGMTAEFAATDAASDASPRAGLTGVGRCPAVLAAAAFIAGIALHPYAPHYPVIWLTAVVGFSAGAFILQRRAGVATILLTLALVVECHIPAHSQPYLDPHCHTPA